MLLTLACFLIFLNFSQVSGFWDMGTTTTRPESLDETPRTSFFRWQWVYSSSLRWFFWNWDWDDIEFRRRLNVVAGISIDNIPLSTATLLNQRALVTSYNYLDPYMNRQKELRIWALGRSGLHTTPYRYRVYSVHRLVPLSLNPEHCHGYRCIHQPRHDVSVIISLDQIYIFSSRPYRYHYPYKAFLLESKNTTLTEDIWMAGSGYETMEHIEDNYKIFFALLNKTNVVDCSRYLPKWWGKFICIKNDKFFPGVQNGGGFYSGYNLVGVGCFEIRYNEERIFVFTDLRYYHLKLRQYAHVTPGQYYEFAYPQWGIKRGWFSDGSYVNPYIPEWQKRWDLYPLG